ncbi:MAG: hypothetical protein R3B72_00045 [Polyangiaceae bacterium]
MGTREAILALKDLWPGADEDTRLAIVEAWVAAMRKDRDLPRPEGPCSYTSPHPGCLARAELSRVSDEGAQMPALVAALELIHDMPPSAAGTPRGTRRAWWSA